MLVFRRTTRQAVVVGGNDGGLKPLITITVLEISGSQVKLGFEADDEVPIHRAEVWNRIRTECRPEAELPTQQLPSVDGSLCHEAANPAKQI